MRLQIRHETRYRYASPIAYAIQTLRLSPSPYDGLQILRWRVRGESSRELPWFIDGLGNLTHCHTVNQPHSSAAILVEGEVDTSVADGIVRGSTELLPPLYFVRSTELTAADPAIEELAALAAKEAAPLDRLHALMHAVRERIDYRLGATDVATTAAAALRNGAGVCQDHAHVFISAARLLGVPARYVSGYLWTGQGGESDAAHAWAEAYVDDLGWVGFDAANRVCPTEAYIRMSIGLDYWSAAPVRGVRRGVASEHLAVKVEVTQAGAEQ